MRMKLLSVKRIYHKRLSTQKSVSIPEDRRFPSKMHRNVEFDRLKWKVLLEAG